MRTNVFLFAHKVHNTYFRLLLPLSLSLPALFHQLSFISLFYLPLSLFSNILIFINTLPCVFFTLCETKQSQTVRALWSDVVEDDSKLRIRGTQQLQLGISLYCKTISLLSAHSISALLYQEVRKISHGILINGVIILGWQPSSHLTSYILWFVIPLPVRHNGD